MLIHLTNFAAACKVKPFWGFPHWYEYLNTTGPDCQIVNFKVPGDLALVALALVDILIHIAGLAAVFFIVYGGIQYVTSQGNPEATAKAQSTIVNALIGLALAVTAVAFVSFLGNQLVK